jgi:hypothetical protein
MDIRSLKPWLPVESATVRRSLEAELSREIGAGHLLFGMPAFAIGKRQDQDDVLFDLGDGRVAEVHLTWRGLQEEDSRWPKTSIYSSPAEWAKKQA